MKKHEERLERILRDEIKKPKGLNDKQKDQLREYVEQMDNEGNCIGTIIEKCKIISNWMASRKSDLIKPTYDDVNDYLKYIRNTPSVYGKKRSFNTIITIKKYIRHYLTWVYEELKDEDIPRPIKKLFRNKGQKINDYRNKVCIPASDILDEEEVLEIIKQAPTYIEKGLFSFIYGSAGRISAVISMKMENIEIVGNDIYYTFPDPRFEDVEGEIKTGEGGHAGLKFNWKIGLQYVKDWLIHRPDHEERWLWINNQGRQCNTFWVRDRLRRAKEKTEITKPVRPHLLRHARITQLCRQGLEDTHIKRIAGWRQSGNTIETYRHLVATDTNHAIDEMNNDLPIRRPKGVEKIVCPLCQRIAQSPDQPFCSNCGTNLDREQTTRDKFREEIKKELEEEFEKKIDEARIETAEMMGDMISQRAHDWMNEVIEETKKIDANNIEDRFKAFVQIIDPTFTFPKTLHDGEDEIVLMKRVVKEDYTK